MASHTTRIVIRWWMTVTAMTKIWTQCTWVGTGVPHRTAQPADVPGRHCKTRAQLYHALCHWEDNLYHRICGYYRDLLRAKHKPVPSDSEASTSSGPDSESDPEEQQVRRQDRERRRARTQQRVRKLRQRGPLPKEYRDVDRVTEWMDTVGYQNKVCLVSSLK